MPTNWQEIITTIGAVIGGGGVLLGAIAWLVKTLVLNRLARDVEKFKIELKASADTEIERVKAFLARSARVHERQVDILTKLYRNFFDAQACFQGMTATAHLEGEVSVDEYRRLCADAIASARDTLLDGRLMIPRDLVQQCDHFFNSLFQGQTHLAFAQHPMTVDGLQRAKFWDVAQNTAYKEIPSIMDQIEKAARDVIHGEPTA
jgi:hypothetical protein